MKKRNQEELDRTRARKIMLHCVDNPTASIKDLAGVVKMSEASINRYVDELKADNSLARRWVVNLDKLGWEYKYRVDVKINPLDLQIDNADAPKSGARWDTQNPQEMLAHQIMDMCEGDPKQTDPPEIIIEDVTVLLGDPADLSIVLRVRNPKKLYSFITERLRCIPGVENTSTCTEAWSAAAERQKKRETEARSSQTPSQLPAVHAEKRS